MLIATLGIRDSGRFAFPAGVPVMGWETKILMAVIMLVLTLLAGWFTFRLAKDRWQDSNANVGRGVFWK